MMKKELKRRLETMKNNSGNCTLKNIAEYTGVNKSTVSRVLNNNTSSKIPVSLKTRDKIYKAVKELNYTPNALAKAMGSGKTPIVLFSLKGNEPSSMDMPDFYLNDFIIDGARRFAEHDLYVLYMPYKDKKEQFEQIKKIVNSGIICGVIANILNEKVQLPLYDFLLDSQIPSVILGFPISTQIVSIGEDNSSINKLCEDYAVRHGYAKWSQINWNQDTRSIESTEGAKILSSHEYLDSNHLLFISGINRYKRLIAKFPELDSNRLVLLEDSRFHLGSLRPAILIPPVRSQTMSLACNIITKWNNENKAPEQKQYIIKRSLKHVKIY